MKGHYAVFQELILLISLVVLIYVPFSGAIPS